MQIRIEQTELSDLSKVFNVRISQGKHADIVIGCEDETQAQCVADLLEKVSYIEIE